MKNKQLFQRDPAVSKLLNDGVAAVREAASAKEIETLRYELEHFVCEGQYEDGLIRILESYLGNVSSTTQPAAWVSGFYGSGKSHLLKMFRHLWVDTRFDDGSTARGLARLPQEVQDLLRRHGLPVIDDLGSGALVDLSGYGLEPEPMVQHSMAAGATVACFSGDKLIGGPQAGIIVGKADAVNRIRKNQLARALRIGKLTIAGLHATLKLFLSPQTIEQTHPTYRMLALTVDDLEPRAQAMARALAGIAAQVEVIDGHSQVGSGSVPAEELPTRLPAVRPETISAEDLARRLREHEPAVVTRIQHDAVLLDPRTIQPSEDEAVCGALSDVLPEASA